MTTMSSLKYEDEWISLTSRYEISSQTNKVSLFISKPVLQPYAEELKRIICKVVATIYSNAYPEDNPTKMLYELQSYQSSQKGLCRCDNPFEFIRQEGLYKKAVESLPEGFRDCITGVKFLCDDDNLLTVEKANDFLNWLNSPAFERILVVELSNKTHLP